MFRALFSASSTSEDMPGSSKHILGVTSLWMVVPIYHGLRASNGPTLLPILLACVCTVSIVFWSNPIWGSILHKLDKLLAWIFCSVMLYSSYSNENKLSVLTLGLIITLIVAFFLLSDLFFRLNYPTMQLISHLLFRYVFFWWSDLLMTEENSLVGFVVITIGYFGHVMLAYCLMLRMPILEQKHYWISCGLLICWINVAVIGQAYVVKTI